MSWIPIIAALIGGGAMGAVITALVTEHRNRRQPIGYKIDIIEVFKNNPNFPLLEANLTLERPNDTRLMLNIDNLSLARITLINKGNQDIEKFKFGVTLGGTNRAVHITEQSPDRHHKMDVLMPVSIRHPIPDVDFDLQPFNRGEEYVSNVYFIYEGSPGPVTLSSPHSTRFVEMPKTSDVASLRREFKLLIFVEIIATIAAILMGFYIGGVLGSSFGSAIFS